ncbi:uncharacterized protein AC631_03262 [Debaryomyces fabryi]|uniref:Alkyl transferase n=1 Tax=Debaryomyces fabryi TaxID=58627 RepID=A0A0V1PXI1_9ASCO|nr:uncharacterized protein AC631_03262 [Debaryomyces fabryi]KSA00952.1 hypothetical protein AC631_03262 [Debaryomyces fabryi]CUM49807.1 unnamed protein product [Debaryomyces fabryi]
MKVLNTCYKLGILHVTVYAFSIENFNRSKEEVDTLFSLLRDRLKFISEKEESYARFNSIRIKIIGNRTMIPSDILKDLEDIEERTKNVSSAKVLNVCFPYTSRDDIVHSIQSIASQVELKEIESNEHITLETLTNNMYMGPNTPPLDILIRTSGHTRLSDFMLWQCNYNCMIEFVDTLWPNFRAWDIMSIIMKWSYYRTLQLEQQRIMSNKKTDNQKLSTDILKELPPHPPFASITQH